MSEQNLSADEILMMTCEIKSKRAFEMSSVELEELAGVRQLSNMAVKRLTRKTNIYDHWFASLFVQLRGNIYSVFVRKTQVSLKLNMIFS